MRAAARQASPTPNKFERKGSRKAAAAAQGGASRPPRRPKSAGWQRGREELSRRAVLPGQVPLAHGTPRDVSNRRGLSNCAGAPSAAPLSLTRY